MNLTSRRKLFTALGGVFVLFILCAAGVNYFAVAQQGEKTPLEGDWIMENGLDNGQPLEDKDGEFLVMRVRRNGLRIQSSESNQSGSFKIIDKTKMDIVLSGQTLPSTYKLDGESLQLCIGQPGTERPKKFESTPGSKIVFLNLRRAGFAELESLKEKVASGGRRRRPQEPVRPFPYHDEEITFENKEAGVTFAGTLTIPKSDGPHPCVLLITGSGARDRDETLKGHKVFLVLADYLTRQGIAVLRVDDRGVGGSTGSNAVATSKDFAKDAICGVQYLKTRKEFNPDWIGVLGHSEGGIIGPLAATMSDDIKFVIMFAGPGLPMDQLLYHQDSIMTRNAGAQESTIDAYQRFQERMFKILQSDVTVEEAEEAVKKIVAEEFKDVPEAEKRKLATQEIVVEGKYNRYFRGYFSPWFRFILNHDPRETLKKAKCPVFALLGGTDQFVPPGPHEPHIRKALQDGGNKDFIVKTYPGLNHMFQTNPGENYAKVEETVAPVVLRDLATWILKRTSGGKLKSARRRPQEPIPPYPYESEEVVYPNREAGIQLAGTLTYPKTGGPFPAAVLISGSGQQDRDASTRGHRLFLVLSDYLTRRGIAVLRFDDRGKGGSTGKHGNATSADFATDALAGIKYLKTRGEINSDKVGLIGHSEGGMIGPIAAAQSDDVAFVVMLAGPGIPGAEIIITQEGLIAKERGASEEALAANGRFLRRMLQLIQTTEIKTNKKAYSVLDKIRKVGAEEMAQISKEEQDRLEYTTLIDKGIERYIGVWMAYFLRYDPSEVLRKVRCPVLALCGDKDVQVISNENLRAIESALRSGGNKDYTIKEFPNVNHMLQTCITGSFGEYSRIQETIAPVVMETIADWILARL